MTRWIHFPRSKRLPAHLRPVIEAFKGVEPALAAHYVDWTAWAAGGGGGAGPRLTSNEVLALVRPALEESGFTVESPGAKIPVVVLWGEDGQPAKQYESDATLEHGPGRLSVVEVEAGGATANNLWRKDLMEASLMPNVDYLVIAVRVAYTHRAKTGKVNTNQDFEHIKRELDALYESHRLILPLEGILLIGY